jgi:hypothetical protein
MVWGVEHVFLVNFTHQRSLRIKEKTLGPNHPEYANTMFHLASVGAGTFENLIYIFACNCSGSPYHNSYWDLLTTAFVLNHMFLLAQT